MSQSIVVLKFGGTSVSTRERWETIAAVASKIVEEGAVAFIACSAVSGVSNLLDALLPAAVEGRHEEIFAQIRAKHVSLAESMGLDADTLLAEHFEQLQRVALGASLIGEINPRLQAQVMARGELMSTTLGHAFFDRIGVASRWLDARDILTAQVEENTNENRRFLSVACDFAPRDELRQQVLAGDTKVVLTQGFIARDPEGHTVLLGRGGSDTSAAYFASILGAQRLEIWTDVPGMFTANPREVPSARLLRRLSYNEAQELATMGAKVLHPRCLEPVRRESIPLHIRCTPHPELEGTIISDDVPDFGAQVKAISAKTGIPIISMDSVGMWQQVGFLADVFGAFKRNGLSVDLVATSETNVTVTLDPVANALGTKTIDTLLDDLSPICNASRVGPGAAVSLVGHNIRAILHQLGPALELFEEQKIYLMSQAASDLNMTFVVAEDQADRLVRQLHALVFGDRTTDELIGPTWRELFQDDASTPSGVAGARGWWREQREGLLELAASRDGATYVCDRATLEGAVEDLLGLTAVDRVFFAIKANPNPAILELFARKGLCFECVSPGELDHVAQVLGDERAGRVLFTPNFAPIDEYRVGFDHGAYVTLDNLHPLEHHPEVFAGEELFLRLDPGAGKGHHKHVRTAGAQSKFGLSRGEVARAKELADSVGAKIVGLHVHVGSGIRSSETWAENALFLAMMAEELPDVGVLNLGGGFGVPEKPGDTPLDLRSVNESLLRFKEAHPRFELWIEPGRYCVATAGVLLAKVTQLKSKGTHHYVGIDAGMNTLVRPALYGAFHEIVNLTRLADPIEVTADIVGPICETGDVLGYGRRLPETHEGDVILIATTGAYGRAMSSNYNLRQPADEVIF